VERGSGFIARVGVNINLLLAGGPPSRNPSVMFLDLSSVLARVPMPHVKVRGSLSGSTALAVTVMVGNFKPTGSYRIDPAEAPAGSIDTVGVPGSSLQPMLTWIGVPTANTLHLSSNSR